MKTSPAVFAKAVVAGLTSVETMLALYPNIHWIQAVGWAISTMLVYFVPNTPSTPKGP